VPKVDAFPYRTELYDGLGLESADWSKLGVDARSALYKQLG